MAKRQTVILYLEDDPVVAAAKQVILDEAGKFFDLIALLPFGRGKNFGVAVESLKGFGFDTVVWLTHGDEDDTAPSSVVKFTTRTGKAGPLKSTSWYEMQYHFADLFTDDKRDDMAFLALCCFGDQEEFRRAMEFLLPGYAVAATEEVPARDAAQGALAFFGEAQSMDVSQILQNDLAKTISDAISRASNGHMQGYVPGDSRMRFR